MRHRASIIGLLAGRAMLFSTLRAGFSLTLAACSGATTADLASQIPPYRPTLTT